MSMICTWPLVLSLPSLRFLASIAQISISTQLRKTLIDKGALLPLPWSRIGMLRHCEWEIILTISRSNLSQTIFTFAYS